MLKEFLLQLAKDLNTEETKANDDGSYSLFFDPDLEISLSENPNSGITLLTKIGPLPPKMHEEFFLKLMKANLLGKETGHALLGLDKEAKEVLLKQFLPLHLSQREWHEALEDFVNYAESWQKETLQFVEELSEIR